MELKLAEHHEKIESYEKEFLRSPRRYRIKVALAALLGYAVFFGAFLLNTAAFAGLVWCHVRLGDKILIFVGYGVCGLALFSLFRSAFVRLPLPPGLEIQRKDFPYLYDLVDSLRKPMKTGGRRIRILVDWNYNAFAFSRPALGIFGPATHYLGIGLPLLASLNHEQTRAVIAHEMAHFSRKHCRFASRLSRLAMMWTSLLEHLRNAPLTGLPYRAFVSTYSRWLSALSIVIIRNSEFEADRISAKAVSPQAVAGSLMRIALRSDLVVDRHWREVWQHAYVSDEPSRKPVTHLFLRLSETIDRDLAISEMKWILGCATEIDDSHPSLGDRVRALGYEVPLPNEDHSVMVSEWNLRQPESTLRNFIGRQTDVESTFDEIWRHVHLADWRTVHHESAPMTRHINQLDREWREKGALSVEKAWKRAEITAAFYGEGSIIAIVDYILNLNPDHAHANFVKGKDLLRRFNSLGILHIESAMERDPLSYREAGLSLLSDYYRRMGSPEEFREARFEAYTSADETIAAIQERSRKVTVHENFLPHDLPEEVLADLCESLDEIPAIRAVYLVRRDVKHLPESSFYVLGVITRWGKQPFSGPAGARVANHLLFSRHYLPVIVPTRRFILRSKLSRVEGSLIHRKSLFSKRKKRLS